MQGPASWDEFRNILCVRPDNLGDVLMTGPAIGALKNSVKGRKITLLASRAGSGIARFIPGIDEVITFDLPWYKHDSPGSAAQVGELSELLRQRSFDAAVIFNVYSQNPLPAAMLCYLAGIPRVAAYCRENPYGLVTDWFPDEEPLYKIRHEVSRQLGLARHLGGRVKGGKLSLRVPEGAEKKAQARLRENGVDPAAPWLILHPGVSEAKRQYPPERFTESAGRIVRELGYRVILTGTFPEKPLTEAMARGIGEGAVSLAGQLDLEELIGLVRLAPLLISNNTGPVHVAAAVGTPVIVLYALTNPQHTPWQVKHRVLPFEVSHQQRSRNTIIRFANALSFTGPAEMPQPAAIFRAAAILLSRHQEEMSGDVREDGSRRSGTTGT